MDEKKQYMLNELYALLKDLSSIMTNEELVDKCLDVLHEIAFKEV